jgi:hypothetical protein
MSVTTIAPFMRPLEMPLVRYHFSHALHGIFELPIEVARRHVLPGVEPVEPTAGVGLLAVTVFDFHASPAGPYQELVLSLYVAPWLRPGQPHPHAAVQPLLLGFDSEVSRSHVIELHHLPHYRHNVRFEFDDGLVPRLGGPSRVLAHSEGGKPILELTVHPGDTWERQAQQYQSFQRDANGAYMGVIDFDCMLSDHEDRRGSLRLFHEHEFFERLDLSEMEEVPCREMLMRNGVEAYHPIITL